MTQTTGVHARDIRVPTTALRVAAASHPGCVRSRNEDAHVIAGLTTDAGPLSSSGRMMVGPHGVLLAVADGMGGHADGDRASQMAVDVVSRMVQRPWGQGADRLRKAIERAHREICRACQGRRGSARMGTTLTSILVEGRRAHIGHVGDSRAYLVRAGKITPLTRDQSYTQALIDFGFIKETERDLSPFPSQILQALGQLQSPRSLVVATSTLELREGDALLLCSDGLTNLVSDEEISSAVRSGGPFDETTRALVDLANLRGGDDNVTVVIAGVYGRLPPPSPSEPVEKTHHILSSFQPSFPSGWF